MEFDDQKDKLEQGATCEILQLIQDSILGVWEGLVLRAVIVRQVERVY